MSIKQERIGPLLVMTGEAQRQEFDAKDATPVRVSFPTAFRRPPLVQLVIVGLDDNNNQALRLRVQALNVGEEGFDLQMYTWHTTKLFQVVVQWTALGESRF